MAARGGGGGEQAAAPRGQRRRPPTEGAASLQPAGLAEGGCTLQPVGVPSCRRLLPWRPLPVGLRRCKLSERGGADMGRGQTCLRTVQRKGFNSPPQVLRRRRLAAEFDRNIESIRRRVKEQPRKHTGASGARGKPSKAAAPPPPRCRPWPPAPPGSSAWAPSRAGCRSRGFCCCCRGRGRRCCGALARRPPKAATEHAAAQPAVQQANAAAEWARAAAAWRAAHNPAACHLQVSLGH